MGVTATKKKLRPLHDKIIVERTEAKNTTEGGIVLPDVSKEKPRQGKVTAVGDGKLLNDGTRAKMTVKEGDTILFAPYAGNEVKLETGEEYLVLTEGDILAIVD